MSREILFKAKTKVISGDSYNMGKKDGEWVTGYCYDDIGCFRIRQFECLYARYVGYEVDPETVSQYTGLTDKNGVKIFEGDILDEQGYLFIVIFDEKWAKFKLQYNAKSIQYPEWNRGILMQVIGNIFDNPELLESEVE